MLYGYAGKLGLIDLGKQSVTSVPLRLDEVQRFIGGSGLGAKILFEETNEMTDPLGPGNILAFLTGPFTGSPVPTAGRHHIVAKSPLTGIWGESDVGGNWGTWLKSTGYDGLIVRGAAVHPVYIYIDGDGEIEIREAGHLWGKDTYELTDLLETEIGTTKISISCIGIAGENLVRFAAIMHDGAHARAGGRCGLGAVMGSKKLKAVVVHRGKKSSTLYEKEQLLRDVRELIPKMRVARKDATLYGTSRSIPPAEALGDLPIKNWQQGSWSEGAEKIGGRRMAETILVGNYACYGCPLACGRVVKITTGPFAPVDGGGYEFEAGALLGASCLIDNMEAIAKGNELCNRYGMDTISAGSVVAFAMEAFERGLLTEKETGGFRIEWGKPEVLLRLIELIAQRVGIGNVLAEGSKRASDIIGKDSNRFTVHVKGLDLPGHDPRCYSGMGLGYATSNRGACHCDSFSYVYEGRTSDHSLGIEQPVDKLSSSNKAYLVMTLQHLMALCDSLKICKFAVFGIEAADVYRWLNWVTGWGITFDEFLKIGERIFNLKRLYNTRCGVRRYDDTLPERIMTQKRDDLNAPEKLPELNTMLDEYYELRGWDKDGVPRKERLRGLGLEKFVQSEIEL